MKTRTKADTTKRTAFVEGEDAILVERYRAPRLVPVTRVTRTGQIVVKTGDATSLRFSVESLDGKRAKEMTRWSRSRAATLYAYDEKTWNVLVKAHEDSEEAKRESDEARRLERERREAELHAQLVATREKLGAPVGMPRFDHQQTLPDGKRLYVVQVPCTHYNGEESYKVIVIRCHDVEEYAWGAKAKWVEASVTFLDGRSSSWPSCGTSKFDTDEDAVWCTIRDVLYR